MTAVLDVRGLSFSAGRRRILADVSFSVAAGDCVGVVGPNGAGKTTLLRLILGFLRPQAGEIRLAGDPVQALSRREVARRAAFVPQVAQAGFAFPVRAFVAMGRTPHLGRFQPEGPVDRERVEEALAQTDLAPLADRPVTELSGGEWQRALLARALAQETPLLLLDEPTTNLDLRHAVEILTRIRRRAAAGTAVVAVLHNLAEAAGACDRILLLKDGAAAGWGGPAEVLTAGRIADVFGVRAALDRDPQTGAPRLAIGGSIAPSDEG